MTESMYLALDFPSWEETASFIYQHNFQGVPVKIGMELFYREGPFIIDKLKQNGHPIFLDLKLCDIPTTVERAMTTIAGLGANMVTIHASGGRDMIQKAKNGLIAGSASGHTPKLIAVTMLTSTDERMLHGDLGISGTVKDYAMHLARLAYQNGADGVVSSVRDVPAIKEACGKSILAVTPGIRLQGDAANDQKRIASPSIARELGADILVLGRTVRNHNHPDQAYKHIIKEWKYGNTSQNR